MWPLVVGALGTYLFLTHRKRGVDKCNSCEKFFEVGGPRLRYIPVGGVQTPFCKKCKPEIFP